jgi:hypothetical protein
VKSGGFNALFLSYNSVKDKQTASCMPQGRQYEKTQYSDSGRCARHCFGRGFIPETEEQFRSC